MKSYAKPNRGGKNYLSFYVAVEIWKAWSAMGRETTFRYRDDGDFDYIQKEPGTPFTAFVNNVKFEIGEAKSKHPNRELDGLVNAIEALRSGNIAF